MIEGMICPFLELSGADPVSKKRTKNGVPVQRFRKEIIKSGKFVKDSDGIEFEINHNTMDHWSKEFSRMKRNGVKIPIPSTHQAAGDSEKNLGFVHDMFREGDSLFMVADLVGEKAIEMAAKNDVSIMSPASLKDGQGVTYTRPIEHVAMTPEPVIPGLDDWVPIAASRRRSEMIKLDGTLKALTIKDDVTADNADTLILAKVSDLQGKYKKLGEDNVKLVTSLKDAEASLKDVKTKLKDEPADPDPLLLTLAKKNREMDLENLVKEGKITTAVAEKLQLTFVGEEGKSIQLSMTGINQFDALVAALKHNDVVKLGEQTGVQVISLGKQFGEGAKDALVDDAVRRAKEAAA